MENVWKILSKQNGAKNTEQRFINLVSLSIAFMIKRVDIKNINAQNFKKFLDESDLASFWKEIQKLYFEKKSIDKKIEKKIIENSFLLQKCSEEEIINAIIFEIDTPNNEYIENVSNVMLQIAGVNKNSKIADAFGKKGKLTLDLIKKYKATADYYEINPENYFEALIRFYSANEICNMIECLPGVSKKSKYDFVFANPESEIKLITPSLINKDLSIGYENTKILIDEENILPINIANDISPYLFAALIVISMLREDGKAIITVPVNCLKNDVNKEIRKYLIQNYLDEVINLPEHVYPSIELDAEENQFAILVFKKNKKDDEIKFVNMEYCYFPRGSFNEIDVESALKQYNKNYKMVTKETIKRNQYYLGIDKYIKNIQINNSIDLREIVTDIFRGYQFGKDELKKMKPFSANEINYRILKNCDAKLEDVIEINSGNKNLDRYLLKCGDIIINARGEENSVSVLPESIEASKYIATGSSIVIRPDEKRIKSKYLYLFLESKRGEANLNKAKNKNALYVGNLKKMQVSCPKIEQQEEILSRIIQLEKALSDLKNLI